MKDGITDMRTIINSDTRARNPVRSHNQGKWNKKEDGKRIQSPDLNLSHIFRMTRNLPRNSPLRQLPLDSTSIQSQTLSIDYC